METFMKWLTIDSPAGWTELLVRTLKVALIAFVVLQLKELVDAGTFDTPATLLDSLLIAGGTLVVNALFVRSRPYASEHNL